MERVVNEQIVPPHTRKFNSLVYSALQYDSIHPIEMGDQEN
jgi:hypothetical protein